MKRPTLLLMLVILASIFLFFLLNLLSEYHLEIPCAAGIDGIGGGSGAIGEWFADADGFPESAGRTVRIGY